MALRLDGKTLASTVEGRLAAVVEAFTGDVGRPPGLAVLRVGDDPASAVYVANKEKACARVGIASFGAHLAAETPADEVLSTIKTLNADSRVDGILFSCLCLWGWMSVPLEAIDPAKDADGLHTLNLGRLLKGEPVAQLHAGGGTSAQQRHRSAGQQAVVIGRSILLAAMALMLQAANATVTVAHSRTADLAAHTREADIVGLLQGALAWSAPTPSPEQQWWSGIHRKPEGALR